MKPPLTRRNAMTLLAAFPGIVLTTGIGFAQSPLDLPPFRLKPFSLPPVPEFDGIPGVNLDTFKGHVSVLYICTPGSLMDNDDRKHLVALRAQGLRIVGVLASDSGIQKIVKQFIQNENPFQYFSVDAKDDGLCAMLRIEQTPEIYVIGRDADVLWQTYDTLEKQQVDDIVKAAQA